DLCNGGTQGVALEDAVFQSLQPLVVGPPQQNWSPPCPGLSSCLPDAEITRADLVQRHCRMRTQLGNDFERQLCEYLRIEELVAHVHRVRPLDEDLSALLAQPRMRKHPADVPRLPLACRG